MLKLFITLISAFFIFCLIPLCHNLLENLPPTVKEF